ncbi:MAG: hypothetical protein KAS23_16115, partial [Anaerohalosphaera sp.]|nr:hypothetical protein [Anaerohalosphaera sp.]
VESPHFEISIDPATGVVTWPNPLPWHLPLKIIIAASNSGGTDTETWYLSVLATPNIDTIADDITATGIPYTSESPTLTPGTIAAWTLVDGPDGMTIDPASGAVSWNSPVKSVDPYLITVQATNLAGQDNASWNLTVMDLPIIDPIADHDVIEHTAYTSPTPTLSQGTDTTITWSLTSRPVGMNIDPLTGVATWPNTIPGASAYTVTLRATNAAGFHEQSYQLTVLSSPEISPISDGATAAGVPYAKQPNLVRGTVPITWQLIAGPQNMQIDPQTGQLTWLDPVESPTPYPITIRATNNFDGTERSDEVSYQLTVQWLPDIEAIPDDTIEENMPYSLSPVLLQGTPPVSWALVKAPDGMTIDNTTGQIDWAKAVASFEPYEIKIQALNQVGSDDEIFHLAVPVTYTAVVAADIDSAPAGTQVTLSGQATWLEDGTAAPDVDVTIRLRVRGTRRVFTVHTDSQGNFSKVFTPLSSEAGLYTVSADHPAIPTDTTQDTFILLGLRTEPIGMRHELFVDQTIQGSVVLRNFGDVPITGLAATIENAPANLTVNIVNLPAELPALGVATLSYTIDAADASVPQSTTNITITGDGGANTLLQL